MSSKPRGKEGRRTDSADKAARSTESAQSAESADERSAPPEATTGTAEQRRAEAGAESAARNTGYPRKV